MQSDLFIRSDIGIVVTQEYRDSLVNLLKILFKLNVISQKQVTDIVMQFQTLFV